MTEQERPININPEALTGKPNPHRMGDKGDIFMIDSQAESPPIPTTEKEATAYLEKKAKEMPKAPETKEDKYNALITAEGGGREAAIIIAQSKGRALETAEKFFPDGDQNEKDTFEIALVEAMLQSRKYNEDHYSAEKIFQEMLGKLAGTDDKEGFIKLLRTDAAWASMIVNIESGIIKGELISDKFKKAGIKESFLKDLAEAKSLITQARKNELSFATDEDFNEARGVLLKLAGLEKKEIDGVDIKDFVERYEGRLGHETLINSMEDLARLIMSSVDEEWRTGGRHELLNKEGEFKAENFLAWIRSRILWYHNQTPDGEINLFSDIGVTTQYRAVNFGEMMAYAKYFMTEVERPNPKEAMLPSKDYTLTKEMGNLKDLALYEVWLFQMSHNFNVKYHMVEGQEEQVPKALAEIYYNNVFTKNKNRLLKILMLSGNNAEELDWILGKDKIENQEIQGSVGKDIRKSLLAYYYLSEICNLEKNKKGEVTTFKPRKGEVNMFEQALGKEGVLNFYKYIIGNIGGEEKLREYAEKSEVDVKKEADRLLRKTLEVTEEKDEDKMGAGIEALNIFNSPKKFDVIKELVSGAMTAALADERVVYEPLREIDEELYKRLCSRFSDNELAGEDVNHAKKEAEYAVEWVNTMVRWTGIQARNDTKAIGYDAWSKMQNLKAYRLGQEGKSDVGDILTFFGLQRLSMNFFEATRVGTGGSLRLDKTLLEVLQGGPGDKIDLDHFERFEFQGNAQRKFIEDHYLNASQVYAWLKKGEGIDFNKMLAMDEIGRADLVKEEVSKVFNGIWKNLRYTFDLPEFAYNSEARGWEKGKDGEIYFESKKLEELMFNDEIRKLRMYNENLKEDDSRGFKTSAFYDKEGQLSKHVARRVFAWLIAKDLEGHVKAIQGKKKYSSSSLERITDFFTSYHLGVEEIGDSHRVGIKNFFFTKQEFKDILGLAKAEHWRVFGGEVTVESAGSLLEAILAGFKEFSKALLKG